MVRSASGTLKESAAKPAAKGTTKKAAASRKASCSGPQSQLLRLPQSQLLISWLRCHRPPPPPGPDPVAALDYVTLVVRNRHDAGNTTGVRGGLAFLAALFDRLGRPEPAATIAGFAVCPLASTSIPEFNTAIAHLRESSATRPTNRSPARVRR